MRLRIVLSSLVSFLWIINLPINTIREVVRATELMVVWGLRDQGEGRGRLADTED